MHFLPAYDVELPGCLAGIHRIIEVHRRHGIPATFFVVAGLLDEQGDSYRELLKDLPLAEIASHGLAHILLRDHAVCGPAAPADRHGPEILESKRRLEEAFGRQVQGFRPSTGFSTGMRGAPELLRLCAAAGYRYLSSLLWGPQDSMPALFAPAFAYAEDGFPQLWEIPSSGWHDNLLKGSMEWGPTRLQLFPAPVPALVLTELMKSPDEEAAYNRTLLQAALAAGARHVTLVWHPWSLHRFDPEMRMLELTFRHARDLGLPVTTFSHYAELLAAQPPDVPEV